MKELRSPWVHWERDFESPGTTEYLEVHRGLLGEKRDGLDIEIMVESGNAEWNPNRLAHVSRTLSGSQDIAEVLRPLFCTVEVNVESDIGGPTGLRFTGAVVDAGLAAPSIPVSREQYESALVAANSRIEGVEGVFRDTIGGLVTVVRGESDGDYERLLISEHIIDAEFAEDVRLVDFTRSVFSSERCELLRFAPRLANEDLEADAMRMGFIANLEAENPSPGTPTADLLRNLRKDRDNMVATSDAFFARCRDRMMDGHEASTPPLLGDYLRYISRVRQDARELPVFEFPATMSTTVGIRFRAFVSTPPPASSRPPRSRRHRSKWMPLRCVRGDAGSSWATSTAVVRRTASSTGTVATGSSTCVPTEAVATPPPRTQTRLDRACKPRPRLR